jgi:hypothetical protein
MAPDAKRLLAELETFRDTFEKTFFRPMEPELRRDVEVMIRTLRKLIDRQSKNQSADSEENTR